MNDVTESLRAAALATEPSSEAIARVRGRIMAGLQPTTDLLDLPQTDPRLLASQSRIRSRLARPEPRRRPAWVLAGPPALLAAAAAVAFSVWPASAPPQRLDAGTPSPYAPAPWVELTHQGQGVVQGSDRTWQIDWEAGTLHTEVAPDQQVQLTVVTREAVIRVVGTGFDVDRDRLGTTVVVTHGRVAVDCTDGLSGTGLVLTAGERHTCAPTTGAGLLGQALALSEGAGSTDEVLRALDRGLAKEDATGAIRQELLAARIAPLATLGRSGEALDAAEAYLVDGGAREREVRRYAARAALGMYGCERALPHLRALVDPTSDELAALESCQR